MELLCLPPARERHFQPAGGRAAPRLAWAESCAPTGGRVALAVDFVPQAQVRSAVDLPRSEDARCEFGQ